jgi:NAD(P)-dependent dehydrogenase (short-subunit alcohol dehydrogenase family)
VHTIHVAVSVFEMDAPQPPIPSGAEEEEAPGGREARPDRPVGVTGVLEGRRAIVTGAARGIGAAAARRFCEQGARVLLTDRDGEEVQAVAADLRSTGFHAHAREADVTDEPSIKRVIDDAAELLGGLDLALANAGLLSVAPLDELRLEEFGRTLEVNVLGTFLTFKHARPHLRAAGGGALLCTASQAGVHGYPEMSAYCASKFAVVGLVKSLAQELAGERIRVCAVAPGITDTEMYRELVAEHARLWGCGYEEADRRLVETVPFGRTATPEEIADGFVYLASDAAAYISGIALVIDAAELSG